MIGSGRTVVGAIERIVAAVLVVFQSVDAVLEPKHFVSHLFHVPHFVHDVCECSVFENNG